MAVYFISAVTVLYGCASVSYALERDWARACMWGFYTLANVAILQIK